jgi:hypothetical protein
MQGQRTAGPYEDDHRDQGAVLAQILAVHPTQLRLSDLVNELSADPGQFAELDRVERAVRDLIRVGLLHRQGECVLPTPAALRFDALETL